MRVDFPNLSIRPQEVLECANVGELLALVESLGAAMVEAAAEEEPEQSKSIAKSFANVIWFAPGQYYTTCKWLYECPGLLDPSTFRRAAAQLIARHEALQSTVCDGHSGIDILRFMRDSIPTFMVLAQALEQRSAGDGVAQPLSQAILHRTAKALHGASGWSFAGSWPKVVPEPLDDHFFAERIRVIRCGRWSDVCNAAQTLRNDFMDNVGPPCLIGLYLLEPRPVSPMARDEEEDDEDAGVEVSYPRSFVHFVVSHAYSDGFCSVPLIQDFCALYSQLQGAGSTLAPLRCGAAFQTLEERFLATLHGQAAWAAPDQISLRATCFDGPSHPRWQPYVYCHEVLLERGAVQMARFCAKKYGVPVDVILLGLVLVAMQRASKKTKKPGKPEPQGPFHLTFYVPMRDGTNNDAMVGLFADWRDMSVAWAPTATVLGFCIDLAESIRHRRWTLFDPVCNSDRILVNILPLDEQERGAQKFRQTRLHEYGNRRLELGGKRRWFQGHHRPARITLEQESLDAWWVNLDLNLSYYSTTWCRCFARELRQAFVDIGEGPLRAVFAGTPSDGAA